MRGPDFSQTFLNKLMSHYKKVARFFFELRDMYPLGQGHLILTGRSCQEQRKRRESYMLNTCKSNEVFLESVSRS